MVEDDKFKVVSLLRAKRKPLTAQEISSTTDFSLKKIVRLLVLLRGEGKVSVDITSSPSVWSAKAKEPPLYHDFDAEHEQWRKAILKAAALKHEYNPWEREDAPYT
jgi:DNA-binding transcriptional regulator LsrR (DeoR family)